MNVIETNFLRLVSSSSLIVLKINETVSVKMGDFLHFSSRIGHLMEIIGLIEAPQLKSLD